MKVNGSQHERREVGAESYQNTKLLANAIRHWPEQNKANPYIFKGLYEEKGVDLFHEFSQREKTSHGEEIVENFIRNTEKGAVAELAEMLPLLANSPGRLGDYIEARVTKTAKLDDEGNTFIDLVVEIKNKWLSEGDAPKEALDVSAKMTFLIDTTTTTGDKLKRKNEVLIDEYLMRGKEANVLCYQDSLGTLGITRPKIVVAKTPVYMEKVGEQLGDLIRQTASDAFSIVNPDKFNEQYRAFFLEFMKGIRENAVSNANYLEGLEPDDKRKALAEKYRKIVRFVDMYEKTPVKRMHKA